MKLSLNKFIIINLIIYASSIFSSEEITPYKFTNYEEILKSSYIIPAHTRFTVQRKEANAPDIVYYFSRPNNTESYPIAILCGGSSTKDSISSIIHFHRYFLQEFLDLGIAVITIEQWGIEGNKINKEEFIAHYTRSQRLKDHQEVIQYLQSNPPKNWNGKLIFLGTSEGGPIVTSLTEFYTDITLATINLAGAGDWSWREELWVFICNMRKNFSWWLKLLDLMPIEIPFSLKLPKTKNNYDAYINHIILNPSTDQEFMGMTYLYHADALKYPKYNYQKITTPFLVVAGAKDSIILSSDSFVEKAKEAGMQITYLRIEDMDHYVRNRPDIIKQSFKWLEYTLHQTK